jgi:hypothetical protein
MRRAGWNSAQRHGIQIDVPDLMRRTTGRTGGMHARAVSADGRGRGLALVHEKESIYRELFAPVFAEVAGFAAFAYRGTMARA